MASFKVLAEVKAPYPYTEPTRMFQVRVRNGHKTYVFSVPTGEGGFMYRYPEQLINMLQDLADDAYILDDASMLEEMAGALCDYERPYTEDAYNAARALGELGAAVRKGLEHLGLEGEE